MAAETELDPVIHAPARLRVVVTLATLRDGDSLSFTRLQELLGVTTVKTGSGVTARTSVSLSQQGRKALNTYSAVLRQLLDSASPNGTSPH